MDAAEPTGLPPDYHTHNTLCRHATGVPLDYARAAEARALPGLAATDHCPTDEGFGQEHRMLLAEFGTYLSRVADAQRHYPALLLGVEADYYPGCQRFLEPFLEEHPFDIVLGSVHYLDYWAPDHMARTLAHRQDAEPLWRRYFELIGELAETGLYDVVTHLDLPKRFGNPIATHVLKEFALPALDRIAAAGMAIEINTSGLNHSCHSCYPSLELLTWACDRGVGLTLGSDAHSPERVGADFGQAVKLARRAGYEESRIYKRRTHTAFQLPTL